MITTERKNQYMQCIKDGIKNDYNKQFKDVCDEVAPYYAGLLILNDISDIASNIAFYFAQILAQENENDADLNNAFEQFSDLVSAKCDSIIGYEEGDEAFENELMDNIFTVFINECSSADYL